MGDRIPIPFFRNVGGVSMSYAEVCDAVELLQKKYCESDPFRLCTTMDIKLLLQPLGTVPDSIKGFFLESKRIRTITVNCDLPIVIQKIIVAHELGHAVLHRKSGVRAFHDIGLYDESTIAEKEANLFAAEYLLKDEEVLDALNGDTTFFSAAAKLCVPVELLDFKFRIMKWKGYKLVEPPISARSNFLANMEVPDDADFYSE